MEKITTTQEADEDQKLRDLMRDAVIKTAYLADCGGKMHPSDINPIAVKLRQEAESNGQKK